MRSAVLVIVGAIVCISMLPFSMQAAIDVGSDPDIGIPKESDEMQMEKRDWNRNLHSWGKRAWQNLQGGWGKRDLWGPSSSFPLYVTEKRAWQNLQGGWGKRFAPEDEYAMKQLATLLEQEDQGIQGDAPYADYAQITEMDANDDEKRAWKNLNNAGWGKRSEWGNFRGSWGKRDPAWTNLKGIWGKRSPSERRSQ
ncbi:PREDICTED: allatostatins MIP [Nicrophorus vespilloides]|uniref:Allatostatins MIP n=1 Tax=Nicrophorus vespilloides TaxID=110193 RepID=A0ABM1N7Y8_NICVS|nr:PREDICTED: allatostatins MIP [Nicrophorus vespilloides]